MNINDVTVYQDGEFLDEIKTLNENMVVMNRYMAIIAESVATYVQHSSEMKEYRHEQEQEQIRRIAEKMMKRD